MPLWSETPANGTAHSTTTPRTRNTEPKLNDSDRTRAGDTSACVVMNGDVKKPPTKLASSAAAIPNYMKGAMAMSTIAGPTAAMLQPAIFSGSPMLLPSNRCVH